MTLNILTTVKSYDELLQKVKIDHCLQNRVTQKNNLKHFNRRENAVCAPYARCEHAAATACAL